MSELLERVYTETESTFQGLQEMRKNPLQSEPGKDESWCLRGMEASVRGMTENLQEMVIAEMKFKNEWGSEAEICSQTEQGADHWLNLPLN
jgi:hypothetical protein